MSGVPKTYMHDRGATTTAAEKVLVVGGLSRHIAAQNDWRMWYSGVVMQFGGKII